MMMPIRRWMLLLAAAAAFGQEALPFNPEVVPPWKPNWELTLRGDRLTEPGNAAESFRRAGIQLRLRWSWEVDALRLEAGTRSALGSDGNRFNAPRWDQQPSNGTQVNVALARFSWVSERAFGTLTLGFQENGLLASEALWDRDLRFLGAGGKAGFRDGGGLIPEASLRVSAGRVRNILGGHADLAAGQLVLKAETGPWSWTAHAGRWNLAWDPGAERLRRLPGHSATARQRISLDTAGVAAKWNTAFPWEARWSGAKNRESLDSSEELQVTAGSRERIYWPQLSFTWQRLSSTGTLYPMNGDEWWFYRRAKGPRLDLSMPLPGRWTVSFVHLKQRLDGDAYQVTRTLLILVKRF